VVSYFLAPGLLPDAARAVTRPLGDHPAVADLVLTRYRQVASAD
jgi:sirohydrochlorin ferrochelatase